MKIFLKLLFIMLVIDIPVCLIISYVFEYPISTVLCGIIGLIVGYIAHTVVFYNKNFFLHQDNRMIVNIIYNEIIQSENK